MDSTKAQAKQFSQGSILIFTVVTIFIFSTLMVAVLSYASMQLKLVNATINKEKAFQIAEAGANYYEWRLAMFPNDFWDGNASTTPGPYVHNYVDTDTGSTIGRFELSVTPPLAGSTVVKVKSVGYTLENPSHKRSVTVRYGIPSVAKYAFLTNSVAWVGPSESVSGAYHSNNGIRFDGTGNAPITSAKSSYTCPSWSGSPCPTTRPGIWGAAPASTQNFWQFPVPNVDFVGMTANLNTIKVGAETGGLFFGPSNAQGYSLVFNAAGTVTVRKVRGLRNHYRPGVDVNNASQNAFLDYDPARLEVLGTFPLPANGNIFLQDHTWVEGTVRGRAVVAVGQFGSGTAPDIIIPNSILYTSKDGSDVLGLLAQSDILISYYAPSNLEINAALIAQNGSAQFYYYPGNIKNSITVYGVIASYGVWNWTWVDGGGNVIGGYRNTSTVYDPNLLYAPPPNFPLTTEGYKQISWTSD